MDDESDINAAAALRPLEQMQVVEGQLVVRAPAKLNLNLLVGPRRSDGFHGLDSYVAKVSLYDEIRLSPRPDGQLGLSCQGADCGSDDKNLALCAARLLRDRVAGAAGLGATIALTKRIPPGKGLGGGSSDAAAVLAGLNEMWNLHLSTQALADMGASLGSDVPLFLSPAAARITGRGELIEPVHVGPFAAILFLSDGFCSTPEVYRAFDEQPSSSFSDANARYALTQVPPALLQGPPSQWRDRLVNDLAQPAMRVCQSLVHLRADLTAALGMPIHMTGSGSALFALCDNGAQLATAIAAVPIALTPICVAVQSNPW